ncbi:FecR family protein [Echinicola vietnamensis]|uniref:Fe2+-dicitrate sensor, membrane component n=1 Tax=Echinicola vietnamensis (strain DSM 17526 / LMG 23754 / KMM 6221) TaxID=926556 RepID=L0G775_ECHVK|nr:FecR domain-containing protein [Echinicola vietnamensis]AGA80705.1 Fe2+-dicitrate sensor, membrane component [Echinicola vietnamensis DSM 17526]
MEIRRLQYLLGKIHELDQAEKEELDNWYRSFDKKPDDDHLREITENPYSTRDSIYRKWQGNIKSSIKTRRLWRYGVAASLACILAIGAFLLLDQKNTVNHEHELSAGIGEHKYLELEDGTEVWLNAMSTLTYPMDFSKSERVVKLTGEAYFKVKRDSARPFKVVTGAMTTRVLGTEFNVSAYDDEAHKSVALVKGAVKLSSGGSESILVPGQKAILEIGAADFEVLAFDKIVERGWLSGRLVFDGTPLGEIANTLRRSFGVEIQFADQAFSAYEFTGKFKDEELSIILTAIARAHELKFRTVAEQRIEFYK